MATMLNLVPAKSFDVRFIAMPVSLINNEATVDYSGMDFNQQPEFNQGRLWCSKNNKHVQHIGC